MKADFDTLKAVKIWTNPSPTAAFAAGKLSIAGSSAYTLLVIVFAVDLNTSNRHVTTVLSKVPNGDTVSAFMMPANANMTAYSRAVYRAGDDLYFTVANKKDITSTSRTEDNTTLVPIEIYGIV